MLVTSSHTRPVLSHLRTCARVHRALQWDMPRVVRDAFSRSTLFLPFFPVALFLSPFSPSSFFFTRHLPFALARVASEESEWRLKRADQNLLEGKARSFLPRNDKWLCVIFHRPRHVRAKIRVSSWVAGEFGPWKLIVEITRSRIEIDGAVYHLASQHAPYLYLRDIHLFFLDFSCYFFRWPMV